MNAFVRNLIVIGTLSLAFSPLLGMKRERAETPEQSEIILLSSSEKKPKIEQFKKINVKPLIVRESLVQKSAYAVIHAILEGKITLKDAFEKVPVEMQEYIANLPLILNQRLLFKVSSAEDVTLLLEAGTPLMVKNDDNKGVPFIDNEWVNYLQNFLNSNKNEAVEVLIKFAQEKHAENEEFASIAKAYREKINTIKCEEDLNMFIIQGNLQAATELLVREGVSLNFAKKDVFFGRTPLMNAIRQGYVELASDILDCMKQKNNEGLNEADRTGRIKTALWLAYECTPELIGKLIRNGADVNAISPSGNSFLMAISSYIFQIKFPDLFDLVIEKKPTNLNDENANGETILSLAVTENYGAEKMEKLVAAGADVNFVNDFEETPLMYLTSDSLDAVKTLVELGAEVNHKNENGKCALRVAIEQYILQYDELEQSKNDKAIEMLKFLLASDALVIKKDIKYFDRLVEEYEIKPELVADVRNMLLEKMLSQDEKLAQQETQ